MSVTKVILYWQYDKTAKFILVIAKYIAIFLYQSASLWLEALEALEAGRSGAGWRQESDPRWQLGGPRPTATHSGQPADPRRFLPLSSTHSHPTKRAGRRWLEAFSGGAEGRVSAGGWHQVAALCPAPHGDLFWHGAPPPLSPPATFLHHRHPQGGPVGGCLRR